MNFCICEAATDECFYSVGSCRLVRTHLVQGSLHTTAESRGLEEEGFCNAKNTGNSLLSKLGSLQNLNTQYFSHVPCQWKFHLFFSPPISSDYCFHSYSLAVRQDSLNWAHEQRFSWVKEAALAPPSSFGACSSPQCLRAPPTQKFKDTVSTCSY